MGHQLACKAFFSTVRCLPHAFLSVAVTTFSAVLIRYGDQALFIRRPVFDALGGFADVSLLEDIELVVALSRCKGESYVEISVDVSLILLLHQELYVC